MSNVCFFTEAGFISDLMFIFTLHFNPNYFEDAVVEYDQSSDNKEHFRVLRETYTPIPQNLLPFFAMRDDGKNFISYCYFSPYEDRFGVDYDYDFLQTELSDHNRLIDNLLRFYFRDISNERIQECKGSIKELSRLILESDYSGDIKSSLYAFFIDPISSIQLLSSELDGKMTLLKKQYSKLSQKTKELQKEFSLPDISEYYCDGAEHSMDFQQFKEIRVSFCYLQRNCIRLFFNDDILTLLLSADYKSYLEYIKLLKATIDLKDFGAVVSEASRRDILDYIYNRREVLIKDIEQHFGFTGANAYYHLSMMVKTGVLKTRSKGRTVWYSVNKQYFDTLCALLEKYTSRDVI